MLNLKATSNPSSNKHYGLLCETLLSKNSHNKITIPSEIFIAFLNQFDIDSISLKAEPNGSLRIELLSKGRIFGK
jgi:hypothetical protein